MGAINGFVVGAPMKQLHGTAIGFGPLQNAGGALISRTEIVEFERLAVSSVIVRFWLGIAATFA